MRSKRGEKRIEADLGRLLSTLPAAADGTLAGTPGLYTCTGAWVVSAWYPACVALSWQLLRPGASLDSKRGGVGVCCMLRF